MQFISETRSGNVVERDLVLDDITGVLWTPESGAPGPLILLGHGGGMHTRAPGLLANARHLLAGGCTVAAINAPGHGGRPRDEQDRQLVEALQQARVMGRPLTPIVEELNLSLAERAIPEWQATLDALQAMPEIGNEAPVGYGGATLGAAIGLRLLTVEPRITAAAFGPILVFDALIEAAKQVTVPVEFTVSWDDPEIDPRPSLTLFEAFASTEKALHVYPGRHNRLPDYAHHAMAQFYTRHLGRTV
ncbi:dienelactone hydrolase family protein [Nocardia flavorosea]|uniref:Alpha/beta fold hydrolase n=1 Tax=Nocardia flavorosea TaxID=53429 RepID=A0A846YGY4_9NOCA|nr:alpha/beta fold hydrolase [Nocardia flavorosea]NKY58247.1 alpha/beta fold hydrolase [Nocardia flavorosea]